MPIHHIAPFLEWLSTLPATRMIAASPFAQDAALTLHLFGAMVLVGALVPLNLRLLGLWKAAALGDVRRVLSPVAFAGLVLALLGGLALLSQRPFAIAAVPAFQVKMVLIALAGVNALSLRLVPAWRLLDQVDSRGTISRFRTAGFVSLLCWFGVLALSRWPDLL
ncbi:hypothetical protein [Stappia sp. ES.058]|uniref:hypothetical protein n=1 Tax=Stappia sp. ES.058 TaxID=1881061 RepID=UPI0008792A3A|nr:hypothetical protein [Stappia sp. ES.058]SDU39988.1 hypothetical protein SAMN05428979_3487 [Stappia sp. ES.058]